LAKRQLVHMETFQMGVVLRGGRQSATIVPCTSTYGPYRAWVKPG
jgi:hypothetical protein